MVFHRRIAEFFLSSLFPHGCVVCGLHSGSQSGGSLCGSCGGGFVFLSSEDICPVCGTPLAANKSAALCGSCVESRGSFSLARSVVLFSGAAATVARRFKYGGDFSLGNFLFSLVADFFPSGFGDFDSVVPVPLHPERLKDREFNQSCVVSSKIALAFKKDHMPFVLERVKNTTPQASFSRRRDRRHNVRGAFSVRDSEREKIRGKKIMLFDDIFTTGSTANECAAALVSAGAEEVKVLTVFRTPI